MSLFNFIFFLLIPLILVMGLNAIEEGMEDEDE